MRRIETVAIVAGQTPMGTLTMATHKPRKRVPARLVRSKDYALLLAVAKAVENHIKFSEIDHIDSWFAVEEAFERLSPTTRDRP